MPLHRYLVHDRGPALWPSHKSLREVLALKATTPELVWSGTYQGVPTPPGGYVFKRGWWLGKNRYEVGDGSAENAPIARYISVDTAMTEKDTSDFTGTIVFELLPDYRVRVRWASAERLAFPDLTDAIERLAEQWNYDGLLQAVIIEDRVSGTSALQTLARSANQALARMLVAFMPTTDKVTRYNQAAVWCKNGCVLLPKPSSAATWLLDFETQLFGVPQAANDDMADSFSQGIIYLENILESGFHARGGEWQ